MNDDGKGIMHVPLNGGDNIGPGSTAFPDDERNGPKYGSGTAEFDKLLTEAWDAAIVEAERLCNSKCGCKKVTVTFACGGASSKKIMKKYRLNPPDGETLFEKWCGKTKVVNCEDVKHKGTDE